MEYALQAKFYSNSKPDLEKALEHDNCGYAFASQATHLFLPQTHNK